MKMHRKILPLFAVLMFSVFINQIQAAPPTTLDYQGFLTNSSGAPIDGPVTIDFRLYNVELGGISLWSEPHAVTVNQGVFSVELGATVPFPLGLFEQPLWLELEVGTDGAMQPRRPITSTGYAFKADDANTLEGVSASTLDQSAHVSDTNNPHNVTAAQVGAISGADLANHAADASAHHARYTDPEAVNAIKAADGADSGLDADLLDGSDSTAFGSAAQVETNTTGIATNTTSIGNMQAMIATLQVQVAALETSNAALVNLLQHFSRTGNDVYVTAANLHIVNGTGATDGAVNGLGNLIVGYNEPPLAQIGGESCSLGQYTTLQDCTNNGGIWALRHTSGSHNLVLGEANSYSSYGGIVAGHKNHVLAPNATIVGGENNFAREYSSSISGGYGNVASGVYASVSGGDTNTASGESASVSGGADNDASGARTSVSGGRFNKATGDYSVVVGGGSIDSAPNGNEAWANYSVVTGGTRNVAGDKSGTDRSYGIYSTVSGGESNRTSGYATAIGGGLSNHAENYRASVSGGKYNTASGADASVSGGKYNTASGEDASVSGGINNTASGDIASVSGGGINTASSVLASVSGGVSNFASGDNASVSGGAYNTASGANASVSGGRYNKATGDYSVVVGGGNESDPAGGNEAWSSLSVVLGGVSNMAGLGSGTNRRTGIYSTVSAGRLNHASGDFASISGGENNAATTRSASVSGGNTNTASGAGSSVSGGYNRNATGDLDWRAGTLFENQ
jgi:hypothetical protein